MEILDVDKGCKLCSVDLPTTSLNLLDTVRKEIGLSYGTFFLLGPDGKTGSEALIENPMTMFFFRIDYSEFTNYHPFLGNVKDKRGNVSDPLRFDFSGYEILPEYSKICQTEEEVYDFTTKCTECVKGIACIESGLMSFDIKLRGMLSLLRSVGIYLADNYRLLADVKQRVSSLLEDFSRKKQNFHGILEDLNAKKIDKEVVEITSNPNFQKLPVHIEDELLVIKERTREIETLVCDKVRKALEDITNEYDQVEITTSNVVYQCDSSQLKSEREFFESSFKSDAYEIYRNDLVQFFTNKSLSPSQKAVIREKLMSMESYLPENRPVQEVIQSIYKESRNFIKSIRDSTTRVQKNLETKLRKCVAEAVNRLKYFSKVKLHEYMKICDKLEVMLIFFHTPTRITEALETMKNEEARTNQYLKSIAATTENIRSVIEEHTSSTKEFIELYGSTLPLETYPDLLTNLESIQKSSNLCSKIQYNSNNTQTNELVPPSDQCIINLYKNEVKLLEVKHMTKMENERKTSELLRNKDRALMKHLSYLNKTITKKRELIENLSTELRIQSHPIRSDDDVSQTIQTELNNRSAKAAVFAHSSVQHLWSHNKIS